MFQTLFVPFIEVWTSFRLNTFKERAGGNKYTSCDRGATSSSDTWHTCPCGHLLFSPHYIMCRDVLVPSLGASLTMLSLLALSFSPDTSCTAENSMHQTLQHSCRKLSARNDIQLHHCSWITFQAKYQANLSICRIAKVSNCRLCGPWVSLWPLGFYCRCGWWSGHPQRHGGGHLWKNTAERAALQWRPRHLRLQSWAVHRGHENSKAHRQCVNAL